MIRVFLADDHAVVRDGLKLLLQSQRDIEVIGEAANGSDAVAQVARLQPDIVVMDIAMPVMNGIEATGQIRETSPSVKVIMLSMYQTNEHVHRSLQAGARGYLVKESAGAEVVKAVRAIYSGQCYFGKGVKKGLAEDCPHRTRKHEEKSPVDRLSPREREVLQLVAEGNSSVDIARFLSLSQKTVETYRSRLMSKLNIKNIAGLVKFAVQHGLTPPH